jgi:2-methylcitrate dehydratase PrpD
MGEIHGTTQALARFVVESKSRAIPGEVLGVTRLFFANSIATSISGSKHPVVDNIVSAALRAGQTGTFRLPRRPETLNLSFAVLATGTAAAVDDFDDTHLATYVHAGPGLSAPGLLIARAASSSDRQLLEAVALGYETQLRVAAAVAPEIYGAGWHTTGVFGSIGAAAMVGSLMNFDESQMYNAFALASEWTIGHLEGLGTMNKSFHAGKAAANGVNAALASTSSAFASVHDDPIERLLDALTPGWQPRTVDTSTEGEWVLLDNRIKPYPCGIVAHAAVEAALAIRATSGMRADDVQSITVTCSRRAGELTARATPVSELDTRLSIAHGVAAAIARGTAGVDEFSVASIDDPDIARLRQRVVLVVDEEIAEESARISLTTTQGTVIGEVVKSVNGSAARPMSESAVMEKILKLLRPLIGDTVDELIERLDRLEGDDVVESLARLVLDGDFEGVR